MSESSKDGHFEAKRSDRSSWHRALLGTPTWSKVVFFHLVTAVEVPAELEPNGLISVNNAFFLIFTTFSFSLKTPTLCKNPSSPVLGALDQNASQAAFPPL